MADRLIEALFNLPESTVYLLVAVFSWAEAAFFLGFVTPGELAIAGGGALAAHGTVSVFGVAAAAIIGTALGNTTGYWLGRLWGAPLLAWRPLVWAIGGTIARARDFMDRRGEWAIVLSRLSSFSRILVPFLAGASRLSYRRFIVFDLPSGAAWATIWVTIGFLLGESWRALLDRAGTAAFLVLILFVSALLIRWVAARIASNQRRIQAAWRLALQATGLTGVAHALAPAMHWSGRRLNPRLALGLSLTLGFAVVIVAAGAVGLVFSQTRAVRGLALIDFPVLEWMVATRTDEAVAIARAGLMAFHWPGMFGLVLPVIVLVGWKAGGAPAARAAVGILGAGLAAYFLDRMVLEGLVPRAEFPSVPVAVVGALLVHATAVAASVRGWGAGVAAAAVGVFLTVTVALGTLVAGWAAPSGIVLGLAIGLGWASLLEVQRLLIVAASSGGEEPDDPEGPDHPGQGGGGGAPPDPEPELPGPESPELEPPEPELSEPEAPEPEPPEAPVRPAPEPPSSGSSPASFALREVRSQASRTSSHIFSAPARTSSQPSSEASRSSFSRDRASSSRLRRSDSSSLNLRRRSASARRARAVS